MKRRRYFSKKYLDDVKAKVTEQENTASAAGFYLESLKNEVASAVRYHRSGHMKTGQAQALAQG